MEEYTGVEPNMLATATWKLVDTRFGGRHWPEPVLDAAWQYVFALADHGSGDRNNDRQVITEYARSLNDAFRDWAGIKKPLVTRVLRGKFEIACRKHRVTRGSNHRFFTSEIFA